MIFKTSIASLLAKISKAKKTKVITARDKYITEKYNERSIVNQYFKKHP